MKNRKRNGARKNRTTRNYKLSAPPRGHMAIFYQLLTILARQSHQLVYGGNDSPDVWAAHQTDEGLWIAIPQGEEALVLTSPDTGVHYKLSAYSAGLVCSLFAWTTLLFAAKGTDLEDGVRNVQCRLADMVAEHLEADQMCPLVGLA